MTRSLHSLAPLVLLTAVLALSAAPAGAAARAGDERAAGSPSIKGSWSGQLRQGGIEPFRVWATISAPAGAGNTVRYSGLDCRGTWTALPRRGVAYRFTELITAGASDECKGRGTVTLRRTDDPDALRYVFRGGGVMSHGVLRRR